MFSATASMMLSLRTYEVVMIDSAVSSSALT